MTLNVAWNCRFDMGHAGKLPALAGRFYITTNRGALSGWACCLSDQSPAPLLEYLLF
jgi:hypothetical protein